MNTVTRYRNPHNPWWRFEVRVLGEPAEAFANAQAASDWIEQNYPGVPFQWDTREP